MSQVRRIYRNLAWIEGVIQTFKMPLVISAMQCRTVVTVEKALWRDALSRPEGRRWGRQGLKADRIKTTTSKPRFSLLDQVTSRTGACIMGKLLYWLTTRVWLLVCWAISQA